MNTHFEQTFLQQIIDLLKSDQKFFNYLIDQIFNKFFLGRNSLIKNNDLRMIIKNTLNQYGPIFWTEKLLKFLNIKKEGGARTAFQMHQAFNLLTFILEISNSKISSIENFKEKLFEKDFVKIAKKLNAFIKAHLAEDSNEEKKEEENEEKNEEEKDKKKKKKKNKKKKKEKKNLFEMYLINMSNYLDRLFSFEKKIEFYLKENENEIFLANEKLIKILQKISESLNYRNVSHKIDIILKKNKNEENEEKNSEKDSEENNEDIEMDLEGEESENDDE